MKKQLSFSSIKLKDIQKIVSIELRRNKNTFDKWFEFPYTVSEQETNFLYSLLEDERLLISGFSEEELKAKFIIPLLNKVNFKAKGFADWYERPLKSTINGVEIGGKTDFLVANGTKEPEIPYFFIQEFKPAESASSPHDQLLAELLVAIQRNKNTQAIGAYVINELWRFMLLEKEEDEIYCYYLSSGYNCLNKEDLKKLYISLQGIKADIIEKVKLARS